MYAHTQVLEFQTLNIPLTDDDDDAGAGGVWRGATNSVKQIFNVAHGSYHNF